MDSKSEQTAITSFAAPSSNMLGITDAQAEAVKSLAEFGTTVVTEGGQLARYVGRVLGTTPHDAVGFVIGDPLHFVRTAIAQTYDHLLSKIFEKRGVTDPQPVSPSVAIPLLRAAYDESRPELQKLWSELIAAAMDPKRSDRLRLSFIDTLQKFDPLDALLLQARYNQSSQLAPNARDFFVGHLNSSIDDIQMSIDHLENLRCIFVQVVSPGNFIITSYGRGLIRACSD